jgi:hypothetical protein
VSYQLILKALLSGALIAAASELARRSPAVGGLVVSLPLVSIITMLWLWQDTGDSAKIAELALSSTLYVNASLPAFILLIVLLRRGVPLPLAMAGFVALGVAGYLALLWAGKKWGLPV